MNVISWLTVTLVKVMSMPLDFINSEFLNNRVVDYLIALAILVGGIIGANVLQNVVLTRLRSWARKTANQLDDGIIRAIEHTFIPLLYLGIFYIAIGNLNLHPTFKQTIDVLAVSIATVLGIRFFNLVVEKCLRIYYLNNQTDNPTIEQSFRAFIPAIRAIVWGIGLIFLLDNLGFSISAVVASLGIGGVAIALASQGVLQDLFSYFAILLDRPFEIGDFIVVGDFLGTVEHVGIKTTRIKSLSGEELILANTDLTGSRIRNFKRMQRRRVEFKISVSYETPPELLQEIPSMIKNIIAEIKNIRFDRAHFSAYSDLSLDFIIVYFVDSSDYNEYMDAQQHINLRLKQEFEVRSIKFASLPQVALANNVQSAAS
jgi:small-conductance mechanosensitive channel